MSEFRCDSCGEWRNEKTPAYLCSECEHKTKLDAIRAFVERVEKRSADMFGVQPEDRSYVFKDAIDDELAAMEKEN